VKNSEPNGKSRRGVLLADFLDKYELAAQLGVSLATVLRWERLRMAPPSIKMGGQRLYRRTSVERWIDNLEEARREARRPTTSTTTTCSR